MATSNSNSPLANPNKSFKMFARASKKSENHLLLSTTYALNNSSTKKIMVGLGLRIDGDFEPMMRLVANSSGGILLKLHSGNLLTNAEELMSDFFDTDVHADAQWQFELIELGDRNLVFTTAHGARAIRFDVANKAADAASQQVAAAADDDDTWDCDHEQPPFKRRKSYHPSIVMQQTTHDGLRALAVCVDEQIRRLQRLVDDVNKSKQLFVKRIAETVRTTVPKEPSLHTIAQIVQRERDTAKESIRPFVDPVFREHYFDIVLLEISRLFPSYVSA